MTDVLFFYQERRGRCAGSRSPRARQTAPSAAAAVPATRRRSPLAVLLGGETEALTRRAVELVISPLAAGFITPGEAGTIAAGTGDFERRLQILEAELPARPWEAPELFNAGNRGYSIDRRESALNSR
jgi:hypothetical protein